MPIPRNSFRSWQNPALQPGPPWFPCSPNLKQLESWAISEWKMSPLGCFNRRPIVGGTSWSSHAFGAALDLGYTDDQRDHVELVMAFLIFNQHLLGVQAVHDYRGERMWRAGDPYWRNRRPGPPNNHIHIEVHPDAWKWTTTIPQRIGSDSTGEPPKYPGSVTRRGSKATARVRQIQQRLVDLGYKIAVDGQFGPHTEGAVKAFQGRAGLVVDGLVGPRTWSALFGG